jgi:S-adenosylmethionine/arginine decarboxylase-like enzyme
VLIAKYIEEGQKFIIIPDILDENLKKNIKMKNYGKELIIDLHNCDSDKFNRKSLKLYFKTICNLINMQRAKLVFWDDVGVEEEYKQTFPHTIGSSAVQFILTSNITIHTLDIMKRVYINIFSCKDFSEEVAEKYTQEFFNGSIIQSKIINRI